MGVKGAGETGTIAASPAIINAVVDALSPLGIKHIDMPVKPERGLARYSGCERIVATQPSDSPIQDILARLEGERYIADPAIATSLYMATGLGRPLLIEGRAGVGKTEVANVMARVLDTNLIRLQCYEGLDVTTALYEWELPQATPLDKAGREQPPHYRGEGAGDIQRGFPPATPPPGRPDPEGEGPGAPH